MKQFANGLDEKVIITPSYLYEKLTVFILLKLLFIRRVCL